MKDTLKKFGILMLKLILIAAVIYLTIPLFDIYYNAKIPLGVDTPNYVHYVVNFREHMSFPVSAWKADEFQGMSRLVDTSWIHFYAIQPFVDLMGFFPAIKFYPLLFISLFLVFCYFLFYEISGSLTLSAALTLLMSRTGAIYIASYSSGVTMSSVSQTFYPLMLYFLVRFVKRESLKDLVLASLSLALGMYSHPGTIGVTGFVSAFLFLCLFSSENVKFWNLKKKISTGFIFFFMTCLLGALVIGPEAWVKFFEGGHQWLKPDWLPTTWTFSSLILALNPYSLILLITLILGPVTTKLKNKLIIPFIGLILYFLGFQTLSYFGYNPFSGHIFPHRIHWMFAVVTFSLALSLISEFKLTKKKAFQFIVTDIILPLCLLTSLLYPIHEIFYYLKETSAFSGQENIEVTEDPRVWYGQFFRNFFDDPDSFFDDKLNYRFYALDYGHNISAWMAFNIPQTKGVFHYSNSSNVDWYGWLGAVFHQETIDKERIHPYIAEKQSLYVLDWYATRYLFSFDSEKHKLAYWLLDEKNDFVEDVVGDGIHSNFVKINKEYTSPILNATNAKIIGYIGNRLGYDSFIRNLGILNYNSKYVVPIRLSEHLEDVKEEDLEILDGIVIYSYQQKNKDKHRASWDIIEKFLQNGKTVMVETGTYAPEKYMDILPDIFPIDSINVGKVGDNLSDAVKSDIFSELDFSLLSPLIYEGSYWSMDYSERLRTDGNAILALNDKILIAEKNVGKGKLIWSGMNFFYMSSYFKDNAENEIKIFKSILDNRFSVANSLVESNYQRPTSEKAIVTAQNARGIVFRENIYGGWKAKIISNGHSEDLEIRHAGPYMMFVKVPDKYISSKFEVIFEYKGRIQDWGFFIINIFGIILLFDILFFKQRLIRFLKSPFNNISFGVKSKLSNWWKKDEDESY